jgi:D-alanyl-D-alanine carboxypeptidase (penicillin-binding protein 5/6)
VLSRACALAALVFLLISPHLGHAAPVLAARAWLLIDATSGARLAAQGPAARLEPASLTKLMTAYVVYTALAEKRIALDDTVKVSRAAFTAPGKAGARMYIEPGRAVTVEELLKGMLVVSGNDAAVALAEHTAGSVEAFVGRMNAEAQRLGMTNTHFANPSGQADAQNYSSAEDIAKLAVRLLGDFPTFAPLHGMREFTYNGVTQASRNRLLWSDASIDGMKTGHLETAGYSIVATATRAQGSGERAFSRRLIAVVLGAPSEALRAQETLRLLNFGYSAFDTVRLYRRGDVLARPEVWKGDRVSVPIGVEHDVFVTIASDELQALGAEGLRSIVERPDPLIAPLRRGEAVGRLRISAGGRELTGVPVVAFERVDEAGLFGRAYDAIRLWWRRRN